MTGLIVAYAKGRIIGNKGRIPWDIPGEKTLFKRLTTGNIVIMGRKTYEDIGKPLPERLNIVVSENMKNDTGDPNLIVARSFEEALRISEEYNATKETDIYIAGGESIYRQAMDIVDVMYITEIDLSVEGDTYFPEFDEKEFRKIKEEYHDGDIPYKYITYLRNESYRQEDS